MVDLRSGHLQPHDLQAYCTKITGAELAGECPTWRKFLDDVTGGDGELQAYLQRVAGYCLTGSIREHAVFFAHGSGGNGKSVFLNTIAAVMGDYATTAPMDVFVASKGDRHPTEVAMLRGARLVTAFETEQGRRWDEAKLKALTGGDPITARFMRQDFFTFKPQFKLFVVGNHRPAIRNVDPAMRRRLHLIPFTKKIEVPDEDLPEKLRAEWPAILVWMVQGCLDWQRQGLCPPQAVIDATEEYFETEDAIGRWIEERCSIDSSATATTAHLFADWKEWATEVGEFVGTEKRLAQNLKQRGYERWRDPKSKARGFVGIALMKDFHGSANSPNAPQPSRTAAWSEEY
jgi:putative DNA primase/helicase